MASEADELAEQSETIYDDSYTLTALRNAAKERGITGYSTMSKTDLIAALNS